MSKQKQQPSPTDQLSDLSSHLLILKHGSLENNVFLTTWENGEFACFFLRGENWSRCYSFISFYFHALGVTPCCGGGGRWGGDPHHFCCLDGGTYVPGIFFVYPFTETQCSCESLLHPPLPPKSRHSSPLPCEDRLCVLEKHVHVPTQSYQTQAVKIHCYQKEITTLNLKSF